MTCQKLLLLLLSALSVTDSNMKVMDLTWPLRNDTVYWIGMPGYNFSILSRGQKTQFWYEANWFSTSEHGGTHLDCPSHFSKGKWRCHEIPPEYLIGPGVVIDVTSKVNQNPDYQVTSSDLKAYEELHDEIPKGAIVIMNSGWSWRYPNKTLVFNTDTPEDGATFHFPGFHEEAILWLVKNRDVHMVGVDTPSLDYGQSSGFEAHRALFGQNVVGLENVANVGQIPVKGSTIIAAALNIVDGSGSPVRILATFEENDENRTFSVPILLYVVASVLLILILPRVYRRLGI